MMPTPLAERIRAKAKQQASPATNVGATDALVQQSNVSATGKAGIPGIPSGQSNIAETTAAQTALAGQDVNEQALQTAGDTMALTEQKQDVEQQAVEGNMELAEYEANLKYNDTISEFASKADRAKSKHELELAALEMSGKLQAQRLANAQYKQALTDLGRRNRMTSKEDFAIAMSSQGLDRSIEETDNNTRVRERSNDYQRNQTGKITMDDIETALQKSIDDDSAATQGAMIGGAADITKTAISSYDKMDFSGDGDTDVGQGTVLAPKEGPKNKPQYDAGNYDFSAPYKKGK
jgi:hypothetical protein